MLYKQTFSKLTVSPQIIQEVIDMTETKRKPKKFILRRLIVAALVMALAFALAMGANAATDGRLFESVITMVSYSEDGETITMAINEGALENADEDSPMTFVIEDAGSDKGYVIYKDADGNTVKQEIDVPKPSDGSAVPGPDVETEAPQAENVQ